MHNLRQSEEQRSEIESGEGNKKSPMQKLSQQEVLYHSRPAPKAQPAMIDPFPPGVRWGLWLGLGVRAFLGLLLGFLLLQGILLISGWEMVFSMTPFTFYVFWIFAGSAAGLLVGGLIGVITADPYRNG